MGAHKELMIKDCEKLLARTPLWQLEEELIREVKDGVDEVDDEQYDDYVEMQMAKKSTRE